LLDNGKSLSCEETVAHIDDGSLFSWLTSEFADEVDLSLYKDEDRQTMLSLFQDLANAVDARRKFGVENNGIALLAAYCFEAIQRIGR
jgi:hypothetical protein